MNIRLENAVRERVDLFLKEELAQWSQWDGEDEKTYEEYGFPTGDDTGKMLDAIQKIADKIHWAIERGLKDD